MYRRIILQAGVFLISVHAAAAQVELAGVSPDRVAETAAVEAMVSGQGLDADTQITLVGGGAHYVGSVVAGGPSFGDAALVRDGFAYIANTQLTILDLSDPAAPLQVGMLPGFTADALALSGGILYGATGSLVRRADVSDPANPVLLASGSSPSCQASGAAALGNVLYVACGDVPALNIYDSGVFVGSASFNHATSASTGDVVVSGGFAYLTDDVLGIVILDVSNPLAPVALGSLAPGEVNGRTVFLAGNTAWVGGADFLSAVDISDSTSPVLRGQAPAWVELIAVTERNGFIYGMDIRQGPHVYDGRDPDAPRLMYGMQGNPFTLGFGLAAEGDYLYGTSVFFGLLDVFDISQPLPPGLAGGASIFERAGYALGTTEGLLHVAGGTSLRLFDIATPGSPQPRGSVNSSFPSNVVTRGNLDYVLNRDGIDVVDTSDPDQPIIIGSVPIPFPDRPLARSGDLLFASTFGSIHIVDAGDPTAPAAITTIPALNDVNALAAEDNLLFIGERGDTLRTFDVSDPMNPVLMSTLSMPVSGLTARPGRLYVTGNEGFRILDVGDPAVPVELGAVGAPLTGFGAFLDDSRALVNGLIGGFSDLPGQIVLDVSDEGDPRLVGGTSFLGGIPANGFGYSVVSAGALNATRVNPPTACTPVAADEASLAVPAGMSPGLYHVLAVSPSGEFDILRNAFEVLADRDGDGSADVDDCGPDDPDVFPGGVDLPGNRVDEDCDGELSCDPDADWRNRGQFVRCVVQTCSDLRRQGLVTGRGCGQLIRDVIRERRGRESYRFGPFGGPFVPVLESAPVR